MKNILFVCTGNSARSIIAEAIINNNFNNKFKAYSAGSNPTGKINSDIKKFLEMKNYDLSKITSKNFDIFINSEIKMDHVITVCNNANNEVCRHRPNDQLRYRVCVALARRWRNRAARYCSGAVGKYREAGMIMITSMTVRH